MMPEIKIPEDIAKQLEGYLEFHMSNCFESLHADESELPEDWQPFDAYCGCFTCESREWLMATFAFLKNAGIADVYVSNEVKDESPTLF
jgi:hypothetical protein